MDRLEQRLETAQRALTTLREALAIASPSQLERDGAIQRFEYTFEACWKAVQHYMDEREGVPCGSPKACFRALGVVGLLDAAAVVHALRMVDDRNQTVHVYIESVAAAIFAKLGGHAALMQRIVEGLARRLSP